ncbi:SRPBCC family protein [Aquimarina gracilis]|uniref:SRPBCC family protein n=1 Tax=Aquimarina gracilis TaxID=874422 RepID=A0ABU5ZRV7_9FLAO|nr:SRPBCC family protein [Aquimarina gracilis]MEB3344800.1 SRPBCC family protein [Aquimarina gracilis]
MKIQKTIKINASAEKVWEVLWGDYGQVCKWASTVNSSDYREVQGSNNGGRACMSTWGEIHEIVENLDIENKTYTYYADGLPAIMKSAKNTWKVLQKGVNTSEVSIDLDIEFATIPKIFMGWMIVPKMKKDVNQTLADLKYFIETGKLTEAKIKSDQKYFKKKGQKAA